MISFTRSITSFSEPNWFSHLAAVFGPTPGTPGRLSLCSPTSAARSGYIRGPTPYFSSIAAGSIRAISDTPRFGYSTVTSSLTSWNESRSPLLISTSKPCSDACVASVAMMSSASQPSISVVGIRSASSTSLTSEICPLNSSGDFDRPALYSVYCSERKVLRDTSNATQMCVGCSSRSMLISIEVNPYTALVCCPVVVEKFSTGSA